MARRVWAFLGLAFGLSWIIWIAAQALGGGPGSGEYILAFGAAGPAAAAIFLSRNGEAHRDGRLVWRITSFIVVWLLAWFVYLANDSLRGIRPSYQYYWLIVGGLALLPAWVVSRAFARDSGVRQLMRTFISARDWRWPAVGFLFFPAILLIPAAIVRLLGGALTWPQHRDSPWAYVSYGGIFFLNSFLFTAVLEEPGWRGFLLPRLQSRFSPLLASILVWLPWALWHAPLDISGGLAHSPMAYLQIRVIFLIPIAIIFTWLFNRSGGNLLSVALFHAGMNTFPFVLPYAPKMLGLIFVWASYVIFADRMWRRSKEAVAPADALPAAPEAAR